MLCLAKKNMKELLKSIEKSENNNPTLTAALQEIDRLNEMIRDIREIAEATLTHYYVEDGPRIEMTWEKENEFKVDTIRDILDDCRYGDCREEHS